MVPNGLITNSLSTELAQCSAVLASAARQGKQGAESSRLALHTVLSAVLGCTVVVYAVA